jgi:predicted PurR-regulated permease PerM
MKFFSSFCLLIYKDYEQLCITIQFQLLLIISFLFSIQVINSAEDLIDDIINLIPEYFDINDSILDIIKNIWDRIQKTFHKQHLYAIKNIKIKWR